MRHARFLYVLRNVYPLTGSREALLRAYPRRTDSPPPVARARLPVTIRRPPPWPLAHLSAVGLLHPTSVDCMCRGCPVGAHTESRLSRIARRVVSRATLPEKLGKPNLTTALITSAGG